MMDPLLLPPTLDELIESIAGPFTGKDDFTNRKENITSVAEELGAVRKCVQCDEPIVDVYEFADRAIKHYGVDESDYLDKIVDALHKSDVEKGGIQNELLCSNCDGRFQKDSS